MPCPSEPMNSFLIRDIPWGTAVALHVAWRVWDPGLAGQGAVLYKCLLGCTACRTWRVPPSIWVQGMLLERGPGTPLGSAPLKCLPVHCLLAILSFGIWVEAPSADPWPLGM